MKEPAVDTRYKDSRSLRRELNGGRVFVNSWWAITGYGVSRMRLSKASKKCRWTWAGGAFESEMPFAD